MQQASSLGLIAATSFRATPTFPSGPEDAEEAFEQGSLAAPVAEQGDDFSRMKCSATRPAAPAFGLAEVE